MSGLGSPYKLVAADIGAGTGIASRLLGDRGIKVIAIEPNEAMRQAAQYHPLVEFKAATAESTTLADNSVDLVTSFHAFHWFESFPSLQEFHRILKPHRRLALVWSMRDETDAFIQALNELVSLASDPTENRYFQSFNHSQFFNREQRDLKELIGLVESHSFIPLSGTKHERLISDLQKLYQKWAGDRGKVSLAYRTDVYISQAQSG